MGKVVVFANQKGGCGKTQSCLSIGSWLAALGFRTLLLDTDSQASLTLALYDPRTFYGIQPAESVAALFDPAFTPAPESVVRETHIPGVSIVPGSPELARVNTTPVAAWGPVRRGIADFLERLPHDGVQHDIVLIDTPPNLYLCTHAAMVAADGVVIPTQPELFGLHGLSPITAAIGAVQADANPDLAVVGYLVTMYDKRLGIHQSHDAILRGSLGDAVFANRIPRSKDFIEAAAAGQPVTRHKPKGLAAAAIRLVAGELLERIGIRAPEVIP
jgi:chromosome partitioning protein